MQAVKKGSVHLGYGVRMQTKNGRLRITIPARKRWWYLLFLPYAGGVIFFAGIINTLFIFDQLVESINSGQLTPLFWPFLGRFLFGVAVSLLVIYLVLWYLTGCYVLEISDKVVKAGRRLIGIDFLGTYDAVPLRRIRFSPVLNIQNEPGLVYTKWSSGVRVWQKNRRTLELDYGLKSFSVLSMAIADEQVRIIKQAIRSHFPTL